jgi:hypothetical protein
MHFIVFPISKSHKDLNSVCRQGRILDSSHIQQKPLVNSFIELLAVWVIALSWMKWLCIFHL